MPSGSPGLGSLTKPWVLLPVVWPIPWQQECNGQGLSSCLVVFLASLKTGAENRTSAGKYLCLAGGKHGDAVMVPGCWSCPRSVPLWWWDQKDVLNSFSAPDLSSARALMPCQALGPVLADSDSSPPAPCPQVPVPGRPAVPGHPRVCSSSLPVRHGHAAADQLQRPRRDPEGPARRGSLH